MPPAKTKPKPLTVEDAEETFKAADLRLGEVTASLAAGDDPTLTREDLAQAKTDLEFARLQLDGAINQAKKRAKAENEERTRALDVEMQNVFRSGVPELVQAIEEAKKANARLLSVAVKHNAEHSRFRAAIRELRQEEGSANPPAYLLKLSPANSVALNIRSQHVNRVDALRLARAALYEGFRESDDWKALAPRDQTEVNRYHAFDLEAVKRQAAAISDHGEEPFDD